MKQMIWNEIIAENGSPSSVDGSPLWAVKVPGGGGVEPKLGWLLQLSTFPFCSSNVFYFWADTNAINLQHYKIVFDSKNVTL
jgi:hypothetical protein